MIAEHFRELYRYRFLVWNLVWREVTSRYRRSVLGFFWTLLNPLLLLLVYRAVFTIYTRGVALPNYSMFVFSGILPWLWLSASVTAGTTSIAQGGGLITRVCMPPQILPAVTILANLVNFVLALPIALAAAVVLGIYPGPAILLLPLFIAIMLVFLYGLVLCLSSLTVQFHDIAFLVQSFMIVWFFLTPIVYPLANVPSQYHAAFRLNPAASLILPFQQVIFFRESPSGATLLIGAAWAAVALSIGIRVFESRRDTFAEEI